MDQIWEMSDPVQGVILSNWRDTRKWNYRVNGPYAGLAFFKKRLGFEFILRGFSKSSYTTIELYTDTIGKPITTGQLSYTSVRNRLRSFSYSLEFNFNVSPAKWEKLSVILAAGLSHENNRISQGETSNYESQRSTVNRVGGYISPKVQYRFLKRFFAEASIPYTLLKHEFRRSILEQNNDTVAYAYFSNRDIRKESSFTMRFGLGYSF